MFESLNSGLFWALSTGTAVELRMNPVHSMILDTSDSHWKKYFTVKELNEIDEEKMPCFYDLPAEVGNPSSGGIIVSILESMGFFFASLERGKLLMEYGGTEISIISIPFVNLLCIGSPIDILLQKVHDKYKAEADLLKRVWVLIDCCFDEGELSAIGGEDVSRATTESVNANRTLAAVNAMSRRKIGTKTDRLFTTELFEFGTCEAGKVTDNTSTKTLYESGIKILRTLKDMLYVLVSESPNSIRDLKTCGLMISARGFGGLPPTSRQTAAPEGLTRSEAEGLNPRRCEGEEGS
ncbi:hypothetical protein BDC45DRAFT_531088 [Circinella umbellata]|nr:hypothetical protein BDC45DRAFT_531088 [Circinella umbellata]